MHRTTSGLSKAAEIQRTPLSMKYGPIEIASPKGSFHLELIKM